MSRNNIMPVTPSNFPPIPNPTTHHALGAAAPCQDTAANGTVAASASMGFDEASPANDDHREMG